MVPDLPAVSRRQLLTGLGGGAAALAGGTVVAGATAPTVLPDSLTDFATKHYPTPPEVGTLWRPTVTEAHAREAVDLLAETVERSEALWAQLGTRETDRAPMTVDSGGWLEDAQSALDSGEYHTALFQAIYGIQFAGEALGFARAERGETDRSTLTERGTNLADRARAVASDLHPYPTTDPGRDLGWYVRIEEQIQLGGSQAARAVPDEDERDGATDSLDPETAGELTASLLQAEIHVRNAERYRDRLTEKHAGRTEPYADHLRAVVEQFRGDLASSPTRDEAFSQYVPDDVEEYGPWEFAHSRLAQWCFDSAHPLPWTTTIDEDLLALRAVALSIGLAKRRGYDTAVERLVVDEDDTGFDSGHALAEKRRARSTYQSVVGSDPAPLLVTQVGRAVEDLQVAKVGFGDSYREPMWKERLETYLYALVGRAKLAEHPSLVKPHTSVV
jgi:hypothetical protein